MAKQSIGTTTAVRGFTQLQRALSRIEDGTSEEVRKHIREIGDRVALVEASLAPRMGPDSKPSDTSGFPGELQHSIRSSATTTGASVYSTAVYGGAINYGAMSKGRGPHIKRASASHYAERAVTATQAFVEKEILAVLDWLTTTFEEGN